MSCESDDRNSAATSKLDIPGSSKGSSSDSSSRKNKNEESDVDEGRNVVGGDDDDDDTGERQRLPYVNFIIDIIREKNKGHKALSNQAPNSRVLGRKGRKTTL